jgi:hypothetical protein
MQAGQCPCVSTNAVTRLAIACVSPAADAEQTVTAYTNFILNW